MGASRVGEIALDVRSFDGLLGRDGDVLVYPEGVPLVGIDHIHRNVENLVRFEIVQHIPTEVRIRVLPAGSLTERDARRLPQRRDGSSGYRCA